VGLAQDPFLKLLDGAHVVRQTFARLRRPTLLNPETAPEVARAVGPLRPAVKAVGGVPVRSALGLHGLALLYYGQTDPLPSASRLDHLGGMACALAAWFSVERALAVGAQTAALRQALPQLESAARQAWDLVRTARNPGVTAPPLAKVEQAVQVLVDKLLRIHAPAQSPSSVSGTQPPLRPRAPDA
jgi:hypothetical protein